METLDLLPTGVAPMGSPLDDSKERALRLWWERESSRAAPFARDILAVPEAQWTGLILAHPANAHPWYGYVAAEAGAAELAAFLLDGVAPPVFLLLAVRALHAQVCEEGRLAVLRAIEADQLPAPWADRVRHLAGRISTRAAPTADHGHSASRIDRALGLFYGFHCDPWHLIGSLYAMEVLADRDLRAVIAALQRLDVRPRDAEFLLVRSRSASAIARSWSECLVEPSVRVDLGLRQRLAFGIASCVEIRARWLDGVGPCRTAATFESRKPLTDFVRRAG